MARLCAQQQAHRCRAIGKRGGNAFEADLRHFVDGDGQHVRGQAIAETRERIDQRRAMRVVVHEHDRRLASTCVAVGAKQHAQLAHESICRRQRVTGGAGRAHRRALAAARANKCVDRDVIARGRDRPGRAEIETAGAANDARARMGAQILGESDVARLIETADEVARLEHRLEHGRQVLGIGS